MEREALNLALEVLENLPGFRADIDNAKDVIKAALAQPAQEPFGYLSIGENPIFQKEKPEIGRWETLYTTPPQRPWVDLTRTQIQNIYFAVLKEHRGSHQMQGQLAFGEALQAAIKEKNK